VAQQNHVNIRTFHIYCWRHSLCKRYFAPV